MSEQLKQELEADTDRLEAETDVDSKTIGQDETELPESKLEDESGNEVKAEDTVYLGKASLAEILTGMADPTEEEIRAAEIENAKPVKQKAKEKLEAEKKKATQKNFADPIIAYLLKRCEEDQGLAEDVMQEGKTWNKCFNYIVEQARKQSNGRNTAVEDRVVYEGPRIITTNMKNRKPPKRKKTKSLRQQKRQKHQLKKLQKSRKTSRKQRMIPRFLKSQRKKMLLPSSGKLKKQVPKVANCLARCHCLSFCRRRHG